MGKPSKAVLEFMERYKIASDEVWEVRSGGAWAVKHGALERVAAENNITFETPLMLEFHAADKIAVICVTGRMGERSEWSIGEATPYNNKNTYPFAMAEKRAKDRVTLKLLSAHGAVYSDSEADDFQQEQPRRNPHVTRPEDISDAVVEYDQYGEPIDNIPRGDDRVERLPKAKAKDDFAAAQRELRACKSIIDLQQWGKASADRIESYPSDWQEILRGIYAEHRDELRAKGKAA